MKTMVRRIKTMLKLITSKSEYLYRDVSGKQHMRAGIIADTCAELADVTELDGVILGFGSVALCGKDGEVCMLMSDGKWYKQSSGTEVTGV